MSIFETAYNTINAENYNKTGYIEEAIGDVTANISELLPCIWLKEYYD